MAINSPKTCILALAARIIIWGLKIRDEIASDVGLKRRWWSIKKEEMRY